MRNPQVENYKNVLGLSCIENHILAIFNANSINNAFVFKNSFVDLEKLGAYFLAKRANFAEFYEIPRIQNDLKDSGVISMEWGDSDVLDKLDRLRENGNRFMLITITPEHANKLLYTRGWRSDHYVLVKKTGESVSIINDIPAMELTVSIEKFSEIYGGLYFELTFNEFGIKSLCQNSSTSYIVQSIKSVEKRADLFQFLNRKVDSELLAQLRDLVGVCKIVFGRQIILIGGLCDCPALKEFLTRLSSSYMQLEYCNLKNRFDLENTINIINDIENVYYEFQNIIKTGVVEYEYNRR